MTPSELLERAERALAAGKRAVAAGDPETAANRLYYAMFHAARAALMKVGEPATGRHGSIIAGFGMRFCKDGALPRNWGAP